MQKKQPPVNPGSCSQAINCKTTTKQVFREFEEKTETFHATDWIKGERVIQKDKCSERVGAFLQTPVVAHGVEFKAAAAEDSTSSSSDHM